MTVRDDQKALFGLYLDGPSRTWSFVMATRERKKGGKSLFFFVLQIAHVPPYFLFPFSVICVAYQSSKEGERRSFSRGNLDCRAPDLRPPVHHQCSAKILGLYNFSSFRSRSYIPFRSRSQLALARSLYWSNKHTRPYLGVFVFVSPIRRQ
jgi:hypothetical protein